MIKIDTGIKIWPKRRVKEGVHGNTKYPLQYLKVGDSFLASRKTLQNIHTSLGWAKQRTGFRFATRMTPKGVQVWRTK